MPAIRLPAPLIRRHCPRKRANSVLTNDEWNVGAASRTRCGVLDRPLSRTMTAVGSPRRRLGLGELSLERARLLEARGHVTQDGDDADHLARCRLERHDGELDRD